MPEIYLTRSDQRVLDSAYQIISDLALDEGERSDPQGSVGRALAAIYDVKRNYQMPRN